MHDIDDGPIAAFMLVRFPKHARFAVLGHLGFDRFPLAFTPGLRFWRLLGVGRGRVFDPHADWQRYALFSVWDSYSALKRFEQTSTLLRRVRQQSEELWTVHLRPVRWHGQWGGRDPFANFTAVAPPESGPWVILTRATIRPTKVRTFFRAVPAVAEHLLQQPALLNSVGVGEIPLFYQATLSLWRTLPDITAFAYGASSHTEVVRRTHRERWYKEELFARFRPIASSGTWDGSNPLDMHE